MFWKKPHSEQYCQVQLIWFDESRGRFRELQEVISLFTVLLQDISVKEFTIEVSCGQDAKRSATALLPIVGAHPAEGAVCVIVVVLVDVIIRVFVSALDFGVAFDEPVIVLDSFLEVVVKVVVVSFKRAFVSDEVMEVGLNELVVGCEFAFVLDNSVEVVVDSGTFVVISVVVAFVFRDVEIKADVLASVAVGVEREESTAERFAGRKSRRSRALDMGLRKGIHGVSNIRSRRSFDMECDFSLLVTD